MTATLYVCPTPLGNLEDITLRVLRILKEADMVAAEDTRRSSKLMSHYQIKTPLISYHQHSAPSRSKEILDMLIQGKTVALISDSGTPGISDPGQHLVSAAVEAGIDVQSLPGPNAAVTALAASGFPLAGFTFFGFLPRKSLARAVGEIAAITHPVVIYESPYRVEKTIKILAEAMPARQVLVAREISKMHEEYLRGTLAEIAANAEWSSLAKGEFTLVLGPWQLAEPTKPDPEELMRQLGQLKDQGMSVRDACRELSELTGVPRREIYALANKKTGPRSCK